MGVAIRTIPPAEGERALALWHSNRDAVSSDPTELALAVRYSLQLLRHAAPGRSVEVRVPPFGAVQVIEGPRHIRGTPPAVIEVSSHAWLDLVTGAISFTEAQADGLVAASGVRADLQGFLPLWPLS